MRDVFRRAGAAPANDDPDADHRYNAAQEAAEKQYHAGEAAGNAAAVAASNDSGFTGGRKSDPFKTGGVKVYESDNGRFKASVGASSDGKDHGVGFGGSLSFWGQGCEGDHKVNC